MNVYVDGDRLEREATMTTIRIAVVRSRDGHTTVAGPHDVSERRGDSQMDVALGWHLEAGHIPAAVYWADVELPAMPTIPELRAKAKEGAFPVSFINEMDMDPADIEVGPTEPPAGFGRIETNYDEPYDRLEI